MALVFGNDRLDDRQFDDLMAKGIGVVSAQRFLAATAVRGMKNLDTVTVFGCHKRPCGSFVTRLSALFSFRSSSRFGYWQLGMGMHSAARNR